MLLISVSKQRKRPQLPQIPHFVQPYEVIRHALEVGVHAHDDVEQVCISELRTQIFSYPDEEFVGEGFAALSFARSVFVLELRVVLGMEW